MYTILIYILNVNFTPISWGKSKISKILPWIYQKFLVGIVHKWRHDSLPNNFIEINSWNFFILPVQKSHTIKNKLLDVKKAISKQEMDRHRGDSGRGGMGNGYGNYGGSYGGELVVFCGFQVELKKRSFSHWNSKKFLVLKFSKISWCKILRIFYNNSRKFALKLLEA